MIKNNIILRKVKKKIYMKIEKLKRLNKDKSLKSKEEREILVDMLTCCLVVSLSLSPRHYESYLLF